MGVSLMFLYRYGQEGYEFPDHIVTVNETWIAHMARESKQQSFQ